MKQKRGCCCSSATENIDFAVNIYVDVNVHFWGDLIELFLSEAEVYALIFGSITFIWKNLAQTFWTMCLNLV